MPQLIRDGSTTAPLTVVTKNALFVSMTTVQTLSIQCLARFDKGWLMDFFRQLPTRMRARGATSLHCAETLKSSELRISRANDLSRSKRGGTCHDQKDTSRRSGVSRPYLYRPRHYANRR